MQKKIYDNIIIGTGPAGLAAAIFLKKFGLDFLLIGEKFSGQVADAYDIDNYLGFPKIASIDLTKAFFEHLNSLRITPLELELIEVLKIEEVFSVVSDSDSFLAKSIIVATGGKNKILNIPGESELIGTAIFYNAQNLTQNLKELIIVGGGDSALESAFYHSSKGNQVTIIHRGADFSTASPLKSLLLSNPNVKVIFNTSIAQATKAQNGFSFNLSTGEQIHNIPALIQIGRIPAASLLNKLDLEFTENGYISTDINFESSQKGVFACGDIAVQEGSFPTRQIATSVGDGTKAAFGVYKYLHKTYPKPSWS